MTNPVNATTARKIGKITYITEAMSSDKATESLKAKIEKLIIKDLRQSAVVSDVSVSLSKIS